MANDLYDTLLRKLYRLRNQDVNYMTAKRQVREDVDKLPEKALDMFFNNWFNNHWSREESPVQKARLERAKSKPYQPRPTLTPEEQKAQRKKDANLFGITLLNNFLPDGETRLKDATHAQLRKYGGFFLLIAKHVKGSETVGRKLTAEQVANLWTQSR